MVVSQDGEGGEREQWKKGDFNDHRLEETFFSPSGIERLAACVVVVVQSSCTLPSAPFKDLFFG